MSQNLRHKVAVVLSACMILVFAGLALRRSSVLIQAETPVDGMEYDLVVVGSTPEAIGAAVVGARMNLRVAMVSDDKRVGGVYTIGRLNMLDLNYPQPGSPVQLHKGFFGEFHEAVGRRPAFDTAAAERFFENVLAVSRVHVLLGAGGIKPVTENGVLRGVRTRDLTVSGKLLIDATEDGDLAACLGLPHYLGREQAGSPGKFAAATLVYAVKGVAWDKVSRTLRNDGDPGTGARDNAAWGYVQMFDYKPKDPIIQVRGLNLGRERDGTVLVNALQIFLDDPLDMGARENGRNRAIAELPHIIQFKRENLPGFERAVLAGVAEALYIRETRHFICREMLSVDHVRFRVHRNDGIAKGSYPMDLQATAPGERGKTIRAERPGAYSISMNCYLPVDGPSNLAIVGRSAGFDPWAFGSARVVPVGMSGAEGLAVAAAVAVKRGSDFVGVADSPEAVREVQDALLRRGVRVGPHY